MRFVDKAPLRLPQGWLARAKAAKDAVAAGANPNDYAAVWRELKDGLANLMDDKCWYCEMPVPRSDNAVDHFRPKGRVSDAGLPHNGYRWLAFEKANLRYACTFCNSRRKDVDGGTAGGKADRFPLLDEATRVYAEGPLDQERPALLDPCDPTDWRLLGCQQEDGHPCAASNEAVAKRRAEVSIDVYHLHHDPTCKSRHAEAVRFLADLDDGKRLFLLAEQDPAKEAEFKAIAERLLRAISKRAPFSGDMHFLMRGQRSSHHPWIQDLLEA